MSETHNKNNYNYSPNQKTEFIIDPIVDSQIPELDPKTKMVIQEKIEITQQITNFKEQITKIENKIEIIKIEINQTGQSLKNNSQKTQVDTLIELINLNTTHSNLEIKLYKLKEKLSDLNIEISEIVEYLKDVEFSEDGLTTKFWKLIRESSGHFSNKIRDEYGIKKRIEQKHELLKVCRQLLTNYNLEETETDRNYFVLENNPENKKFKYDRTFGDTVQETFVETLMELHLHEEAENVIKSRMKEFESSQNLIIDGSTYKNWAKIGIRSFIKMEKYDEASDIIDKMIEIIKKEQKESQFIFAQKGETAQLQTNPYEELLSEFNLLKAQNYREKYLNQKPNQRLPKDLKIAKESIQVGVQFYRDLLKRSINEYDKRWANKQPENSTQLVLKETLSKIKPELLSYFQLELSEDRYFNGGEPYLFAKFGNVLVDYGANNTLLELAKIAALSENYNLEGNNDYTQILDGGLLEVVFDFLKAQSIIKKNPTEAKKMYQRLGAKNISDKISDLKTGKNEKEASEGNIKVETTNKFPNFDVDLLAQIGLINAEIYEYLETNLQEKNTEITETKISQPQKLTLIRSLYRLKTHFTKFNISNKLDQKDIKILQFINSLNEVMTELIRKNIGNLRELQSLESFLWQSEKILISIDLPI